MSVMDGTTGARLTPRIRCCVIAAFAASASLLAMGCGRPAPADMLITGGTIYTMKAEHFYAQAVAVSDGRVVFVGDEDRAMRYRGPETRVLDLEGATLLPGLVDAHAHLLNLGSYIAELQLTGTKSVAQIRSMVEKRRLETPEGEWIIGRGWDQNDWEVQEFPTWRDLDGTESNPIYLKRVDGHAVWINSTALRLCGITRATPNPPGGEILRDADGRPTGVLVDKAVDIAFKKIPPPSRAEKKRRMRLAIAECQRFGLTGVHDAGVTREELEILDELEAAGELGFRVYAMLDADEDSLFAYEEVQKGPRMDEDAYVRVGAVKHYADGALGSRGALLLEPYSDRPGHRGYVRNSRQSLQWWTGHAMDNGFQMCVHAIGDGANHMMIDIYEEEIRRRHARDHRLRIEHAQVLSPDDIQRMGKLGIIAAMQPTHCTSDMYWAERRIGPERIKGAYAWRSLIDAGVVIACGSDFPVEAVSPLWGIYAAVTRQDREGWPRGGWYPQERMSREEAVAGFTTNAAFAEFTEHEKGTIEKSNIADFTVLDRDVFEVPAEELLVTQVMGTIVGGRVVFDRLGRWRNLAVEGGRQ
jgi:predicted amidohydrolase YtcJ